DEEAEARRAYGGLGSVQEVEALSVAGRRLADLPQLAQEAVQLAGRDARRVLAVELLDPVEHLADAALRLRGGGDDRRSLPEARREPLAHVLYVDLGHVPLREHDQR